LGFGRQIGLFFIEAFGVFSAKLSALVPCPWENVSGCFSLFFKYLSILKGLDDYKSNLTSINLVHFFL